MNRDMNMPTTRMVFRTLAVLLVLAGLSACGFHLRGEVKLRPGLEQLRLAGVDPYSELGRMLVRGLEGAGARVLAPGDTGPAAELRILDSRRERRVLSVRATGKVQEYELVQHLDFGVRAADGEITILETFVADGGTLLPRQTLLARRDYLYDASDPLGKSGEEAALYREMQSDLVRLLLGRLEDRR